RRGSHLPLLGIPVIVKDNIDTTGMPTTAGSWALAGSTPPDAFIVQRLKAAGALIIAKANLSEWANFRSAPSSSGWSGIGGQTNMPYGLDRNPCGSSPGAAGAAAAHLAARGVDPSDPATAAQSGHAFTDYTQFLDKDALKGARIGVWRVGTYDPAVSPEIDAIVNTTVANLEAAGATIVDPARIEIEPAYDPE